MPRRSSGGALVYSVTLERGTDGTYLAWVDDLPGCAVRAESRETVLAHLPGAIRSFLEWAGGRDLPTAVEIEVVDEVESEIEAGEDTEVMLRVDREPLTGADWRVTASLLDRSRSELLQLLERFSDVELRAGRAGGERTIREELEHVAFVELMYAAWTFDVESKEGLRDFLAWTRDAAARRMAALASEDGATPTTARWAGAPRPEPWSARKAARRLLWHELLHVRAVRLHLDRMRALS